MSLATDLDNFSAVCNDDNRVLAEMSFVRGDKQPSRVLRKTSWLYVEKTKECNWVTIDKAEQADFFKSIAIAVPNLIGSMKPLLTANIPLEASLKCEICSSTLPPVYWVRESDSTMLKPVHKPDEIGAYERGLRNQLSAFQVMAKVPPHNVGDRAQDDIISIKLTINPSRLAHRALSYLRNINDNSATPSRRVSLKVFTEPGHSDSLVFSLEPFARSISALAEVAGREYKQPPNFPNGLELDPKQLITVGYMVHRENCPMRFREREDEEEVVPGLPLRIVGRAEREVECAGGIIADAVGAGKTVMTIALVDLQTNHDTAEYRKRQENAHIVGAKAVNSTLIFVPKHIIEQWVQEIQRFSKDMREDDVVVLQDLKDLTSKEKKQKLEEAKFVVASDDLFSKKIYREKLSKFAATYDLGDTSSERTYREWQSKCVHNIRAYLRDYLDPQLSKAARRDVAGKIQDDYSQCQQQNYQLLDAIVRPSSRKGAKKTPAPKETKRITKKKVRSMNGADMFMDECILFEFFSWSRIVWDEVSYRNVGVAQFLSTASTNHKWLLSGTPPRQNLSDIDYMARALNISLARSIDLRLGLPPITVGPTVSIQTKTELCTSYGKMKSDKFVKDRHEQAEIFLKDFACSNKAQHLKVKVVEHVVVSSSTLVEKAIYLEKQQAWRQAQMMPDNLETDDLLAMLRGIGHTPGTCLPKDLSSKTLSYAASLPTLGQENITLRQICDNRLCILGNSKEYIAQLFKLAVWLGWRVPQCRADGHPSRSLQESENVSSTAHMQRLLYGFEKGRFYMFRGMDTYLSFLSALVPAFTGVQLAVVLEQAITTQGIDLAGVLKSQLLPMRVHRDQNDTQIWTELYNLYTFAWHDFYRITSEDVNSMELENLRSFLSEYMRRSGKPSLVGSIHTLDTMADAQLRQRLKEYLPDIQKSQKQRRDTYVNPQFDKSALDMKNGVDLAAEAQLRGLKIGSKTRDELIPLIVAHEDGGAKQSEYDRPNIRALLPSVCPPMLHMKKKLRGANIPATQNEFKEISNMFVSTMNVLRDNGDQLRRAELFSRLESQVELRCMECNTTKDLVVNLGCGHIICRKDLGSRELCGDGTTACESVVSYNAVPLTRLAAKERQLKLFNSPAALAATGSNSKYSSKITSVANIIQQISDDDSIVVFTQHKDIIRTIIEALHDLGIKARTTSEVAKKGATVVTGTKARTTSEVAEKSATTVIEGFKRGDFRVLILEVDAPGASGANLFIANHVIFATPFSTTTQDLYDSCMEQAKGRCARRGQTKDVHIYHCVVDSTIEVDMLETRNKKHVRVQSGQALGWLVDRQSPESVLQAFREYDPQLGDSTRVNSLLREPEIWKAIGETDYITVGGYNKSTAVKDAAVPAEEMSLHSNDIPMVDADDNL